MVDQVLYPAETLPVSAVHVDDYVFHEGRWRRVLVVIMLDDKVTLRVFGGAKATLLRETFISVRRPILKT